MSVNVNGLPLVTELNASDRIPAVIGASNEGRAITMASLGAQVAGGYTSAQLKGILPGCDLDTVSSPGVWTLDTGQTYTNTPAGVTYGVLEVISSNTSLTRATMRITTASGVIWERYRSTTWGSWYPVQTGILIQRGSTNTASVTFGTEYAAAPIVVCTVQNTEDTPRLVWIDSKSTTGFTVKRKMWSGSAWSDSTLTYNWIAIGARSQ